MMKRSHGWFAAAMLAATLGLVAAAAAQAPGPGAPEGVAASGPGGPGPGPGAPDPGPVGPGGGGKPVNTPPKAAPAKLFAFTGSWSNVKPVVGIIRPGIAPLQPEYEKKLEALAKLAVAGSEVPGNEPSCIPNGPIMNMSFGMRVFADADQMAIITSGPRIRYVWMGGRAHTSDDYLFETYDGEAIAHWEGAELVVDTIGMKETDEIVFGVATGNTKTHLIERWKLTAPGALQITTTIEDPIALTGPWTFTRTYRRTEPGNEVTYCTNATDRTRNGGFDLTPPAGGYVPPGAGKN